MFKEIVKKIKSKINKDDVAKVAQESLPYYLIGEKEGIDVLVTRFYFHMDNLDSVKECRELHGKSLETAAEKLKMFLSGWFGGPSLYIEKYGHPRMRKRHFPFSIGEKEKDQWLLCMREALNDMDLDVEFDQYLWQSFRRFAEHMRNRD